MPYRVLLVEDDEACAFIMKRYQCFKELEFEIIQVASNGKEALLAMQNKAFDLVLTDISMPIMDGLEFAKCLRERDQQTPIIFISTYEDFTYARQAIQVGAMDYLSKPVQEKELYRLLKQVEEKLQKEVKDSGTTYFGVEGLQKFFEVLLYHTLPLGELLKKLREEMSILSNEKQKEEWAKQLFSGVWMLLSQEFSWLTELTTIRFEFGGEELGAQIEFYLIQLDQLIRMFELSRLDVVLNQICQIVITHIEQKNIFDVVAEEMELSKDYIGKLFKKNMNRTFNDYVTFLKIEYAKYLMKTTRLKIYEISERMGYDSTDYFTKLFKTSTGMTPIKYKKHYMGMLS